MDDNLLFDRSVERQSTCELELDANASDVLNKHMDKDGFMLNPGLSALWEEEKKRREHLSITKPMETPDLEVRDNIMEIDNEIEFRNKLIMLLENRLIY